MKKNIFLLFTVIFVCSYAQERFPVDNAESVTNSQGFHQNEIYDNPKNDYIPMVQKGKLWSVLIADFYPGSIENPIGYYTYTTEKYMFNGDTIVNGIEYNKLYVSPKENPVFPNDWSLKCWMREDENKKVWHLRKPWGGEFIEELYYDFSLQIGDTIDFFTYEPLVVEDIVIKTMYNGEQRRAFLFSLHGNLISDYWIEGIGNYAGLLTPFQYGMCGGFYELLCYHENDVQIFFCDQYQTCYKKSSLEVINFDGNFKIYPNPTQDNLYLENADALDVISISLVNIQGQVVRQYEPNTTQIDVSEITRGIYFIKIATKQGEVVKHVVKQ